MDCDLSSSMQFHAFVNFASLSCGPKACALYKSGAEPTMSWSRWGWRYDWMGCIWPWSPCRPGHYHGLVLSVQNNLESLLVLHDTETIVGESYMQYFRSNGIFCKHVFWMATDFCGRTQPGQVFLLLFLCAVSIDGVHDQWGLHTHDRAIAAVHSLHLTRDETVRHVTCASTAVTLIEKCARVS